MKEFEVPEDLRGLARQADREWREEMAAREADAELMRLKERGLPDVMWEAMHAGHDVQIHVGDRVVQGRLTAVRNDLAMLVAEGRTTAINTRMVDAVHRNTHRSGTGTVGDPTFGSMHAYLLHLEGMASPVRLMDRSGAVEVAGRVVAVADDHVLVAGPGGEEWAVSRRSLALVEEIDET